MPNRLTEPHSADEIFREFCASPKYRRDLYFSHCTLREIGELKTLLHAYKDDDFVHATDEDGNTGFLLAAAEDESLPTLQWLQEKGVAIDQPNRYGRTSLMEATLWGRYETVRYLAGQGIDVRAKDGNGMSALDLAAELERNVEERAQRAGIVYRELLGAYRQRQLIHNFLRQHLPTKSGLLQDSTLQERNPAFFHRTSTGQLHIYRPHTLLPVPFGQAQKAFASLDRGPGHPFVNVMSGYSRSHWPHVLDNSIWGEKAFDLCQSLGLRHSRGQASHVEIQLAAYLVQIHSLAGPYKNAEEAAAMEQLQEVLPPKPERPTITVSKNDLCGSCKVFVGAFEDVFEMGIVFSCVGDRVFVGG